MPETSKQMESGMVNMVTAISCLNRVLIHHQKYSIGIKYMRLKNGVSRLERRNGDRLCNRLYILGLDSKLLCSLFSSLVHEAHC